MTTWADIKENLLTELAASKLNAKDVSKGDERITFKSATDLRALIDLIDSMEDSDAAITTLAKRIRI